MAETMRPPHEVQEPFFKLLGDELIALTPEHWSQIKMSLDRVPATPEAPGGLMCVISSPEGFPEEVAPSEQLVHTIQDLDRAFSEHGARFRAAECRVNEEAPDDWRLSIDYQY